MAKTRLGVIFGGRSVEHEVSVVSAMDVLAAADSDRFDVVPFGVTRDGRWLTPDETRAQLRRDEPLFSKKIEADVPRLPHRPELIAALAELDVAFPLIHGENGEDGTLQGMLEMFGVPYVGCGVAASAIGLDKVLQKRLFAQSGLNVARFETVTAHHWAEIPRDIVQILEEEFAYPFFVKPSNGGSSVGVTKVRSREDIDAAMTAAFAVGAKALIEMAVDGREVECGVIGNEMPEASPIGEITLGSEFYDYRAKYLEDTAQIVVPADVSPETSALLQEMSVSAFQAIDGSGFARVDFFLTPDGTPIINEVNTLPGFRPVSMFPRLWAAAGVTYRELITKLVDLALLRFARKEARGA